MGPFPSEQAGRKKKDFAAPFGCGNIFFAVVGSSHTRIVKTNPNARFFKENHPDERAIPKSSSVNAKCASSSGLRNGVLYKHVRTSMHEKQTTPAHQKSE
jgi:hypothetical protein